MSEEMTVDEMEGVDDPAIRFHARDGWYFGRKSDGSVRITIEGDPEAETDMALGITFDPATWASIVAFVSSRDDNAEAFVEAQRLHG